jgi:hypothetical protein
LLANWVHRTFAPDAQGLLVRVDRPIDKDSELHPLVRRQFQGGLAEDQRLLIK